MILGMGNENALMMHCTLSSARAIAPLAMAFQDRFTTTAFDMPSHGQSADWDFNGDLQDRVTKIAESFIQTPIHLIGHSFGATVALRLMAKMPELIKSVVLFEPVFAEAALQRTPKMRVRYEAQAQKFAQAMNNRDNERATMEFLTMWGDGTPWDAIPQHLRQSMVDKITVVEAGTPALHRDDHGLLGPEGLTNYTGPALFIRGGLSVPIVQEIHAALIDVMPQALDQAIEGAGHMVPMTHQDECVKLMQEFYHKSGF
jgi:pimeloyl-ACP methyl ester carboxylesterase